MQFDELETNRLYLTNISSSDLDFIYNQFSDDFINKYLFDAEPVKNKEEAQEIINFYTMPEPRNQHRWIMVLKGSNAKIGTCGFHCIDNNEKSAEIGYDLLEEFNGKGFMHEALTAIIDYAKNRLNIETIEAHVYKDNGGSLKLLEKIGFEYTGVLYLEFGGEKYKHHILYKTIH